MEKGSYITFSYANIIHVKQITMFVKIIIFTRGNKHCNSLHVCGFFTYILKCMRIYDIKLNILGLIINLKILNVSDFIS